MIVPDVNVVVAAFRADHPHHDRANASLTQGRRDGDCIVLLDLVRVGFVRIVTSPRIFASPSAAASALAFADALAEAPFGTADAGSPRRWQVVGSVIEQSLAAADLVVDAYIAAAAIDLGATVLSFDTDFARFEGVRWQRPE